jgi:hypothetical protein
MKRKDQSPQKTAFKGKNTQRNNKDLPKGGGGAGGGGGGGPKKKK